MAQARPPPNKFTVFADAASEADAAALNEQAASLGAVQGVALVPGGPFWVETVVTPGALPHRVPSPRCTAESMHHLWLQVDTVDVEHDKAVGVGLLARRLGVTLSDCIAMGDGANDATMLAAVGLGVAMRQGREEAKAAAKRVSAWTNDEDAVARELEAILAERK